MSDIFNEEPIVDPNEEQQVTLDDLVGEGRKYKSPDELAKAYNHADAFIESQKAERQRLEAELKVLKDIVEARQKPSDAPKDEAKPSGQEPPVKNPDPKADVDIGELVRQELASANEQKKKTDNINRAAEALNRVYGSPSKAQEAIRSKAAELGVGFEWLRNLASDSPEAMLRAMGVDPASRPGNSPGYSPDIEVGRDRTNVRNYAYYNNIRKTDLKRYNSPEVRKQMFDDAQKLGDKFYS